MKIFIDNNEKAMSGDGRCLVFKLQALFPTEYKQFHGVKGMSWKLGPAPAQQHETNTRHSPFLDCPLDLQACHPLMSRH
ncbi:MAG: hypothetical protein O7D30_09545 [Rickettsia endosymbiont of Ixodes persulcatus]|nr:hypothetical protein [Rickettsia endosymbiont of Ixodes persulcatus]